MQQNSATIIDEMSDKPRYSSLEITPHGTLPKWLEDMSNNVPRSKSVNQDFYPALYLEMNNNKDSPKLEEFYDAPGSSTSTRSNSAKHGRRAILSSTSSTPIPNFVEDLNERIVPNLNNIDLNEISQAPKMYEQYYKKNVEDSKKSELSNSSNGKSTSESKYNPSLLESGRRSRAEILDDTTLFNDLISTITEHTPHKIVPEHNDTKTQKIDNKTSELHVDKLKESDKNKFDEIYKSKLKNRKMSPNKRMRYRKFKYKQGSGVSKGKQIDLSRITSKIDEIFIIPELPTGAKMVINIMSTWGDKYYVGLNGIELFSSDGNIIPVKKITAPDVNVLPECINDPRIVSNLLDGVNRTHDDTHLWLAPFDQGKDHLINIDFDEYTQLAMMRIWNYNKSRIHSYRGARYIVITLDDVTIFKGEIAQACGSVSGPIESFGDTILFTTIESILEKISLNDEAFTTLISTANAEENVDRPTTATAPEEPKQRPYTHAKKAPSEEQNHLIGARKIDLVFILNWGRPDLIGLTGLEIIGESDSIIPLTEKNISCNVKGHPSRLIDDDNLTNDFKHMWCVKYPSGKDIMISINFDNYTYISGLRIWNYNESIEKSFAGVRLMKIYIDNNVLPNPLNKDATFLLRRAPGNIHYDFVQEIIFTSSPEAATSEALYDFNEVAKFREESFEQPNMPQGFIFQIVIYTTWGDQYYVGLNGIELYDHLGRMIILSENNICAHPESVNVLPEVSGDIRTPDKLINGLNESRDGSNSWLAPVIPKCLNRIYIVLDQPVTISVIKLWNYFKTPSRGVKEFGILVDDLLVYNGILDKATEKTSVKYRSILFTSNADVIRKEMATIVKHSIDSQGTVLMNDKLRMTTGGSLPSVDQSLRPFTSVNHLYRGRTSQSN